MAVDGPASLLSTLSERRFGDIEGTRESSWVDFKGTLYATRPERPRVLTTKGAWELCKDVAAFANADGGSLVLGFPEVLDPAHGVKVAGRLRPIRIESCDLSHYKDKLLAGVYPPVRTVEMVWYADETREAGCLLIHVRASDDGPHLMRHFLSDAGNPIEAFGLPVRNDDRTEWYPPERIHHMLRLADRPFPDPVATGEMDDETDYRASSAILELENHQFWTREPYYVLQAMPTGGRRRLEGFYDEVRSELERPADVIRDSGFGLRGMSGGVDVIEGSLVARRQQDAAAWIDQDGLMTVGALATASYLGWALNQNQDGSVTRINSIVLVELTAEFCRFVHRVLVPRADAQRWTYRVTCDRFVESNVQLGVGRPPQFPRSGSFRQATSNHWVNDCELSGDSSADALALLEDVYALFGLPQSAIPFVTDGVLDLEALRALG